MTIAELWRYPAKSMAGEQVQSTCVSDSGMQGDRVLQVRDGAGHLITSRTHPALLGLHATTDEHDAIRINGVPWDSPQVHQAIEKIVGRGAKLAADASHGRFDVLPLLIATDGAIAEFGRDRRRLRPNIVIAGVEGLTERSWEQKTLAVGEVVIAVDSLRGRCVMTTFDPDSLEHDPRVLHDIVRRFGGRLALNCWVRHGGTISVGDKVELLP